MLVRPSVPIGAAPLPLVSTASVAAANTETTQRRADPLVGYANVTWRVNATTTLAIDRMTVPTNWMAPGCRELLLTGEKIHQAQRKHRWTAPMGDPEFAAICNAKILRRARGTCYRYQKHVSCMPSFLVIGFTKSGTSVFFQYAAQHHLVRVAQLKEPAFLGSDVDGTNDDGMPGTSEDAPAIGIQQEEVQQGQSVWSAQAMRASVTRKPLKWYMSLFPNCPHCERGEATPGYAWRDYSAAAAAQARLLLGYRVRLIVLVREPIRRAVSHYLYFGKKRHRFHRVANLSHALHEALDEFERCIAHLNGEWHHLCTYRPGRRDVEVAAAAIARVKPELWRLRHGKISYELLQASLYSEHLLTWRAHFPATSFIVLDAAMLLDFPLRAMRRFERHLSLPNYRNYTLSQAHALGGRRGGPRPGVAAEEALERDIDEPLRARLQAFFTPFNRRLQKTWGVGWKY